MSFLTPSSSRPSSSSSTVLVTTTSIAAAAAVGTLTLLLCAAFHHNYHKRLLGYIKSIPPLLYDVMILNMTEVWYRTVLGRLDDGSAVLDVGVGTAGALLRCSDLIRTKNLRIVGLDYNSYYIDAAKKSIAEAGLDGSIRVICMSVYDEHKMTRLGHLLDDMGGSASDGDEGEDGAGDDDDNNDDNDDEDLLSHAPVMPSISPSTAKTIRDRTQDSRVGHHHPHLVMREEIKTKRGTVEAIGRSDSEVASEAESEAEREHKLHDLLDTKLRRMDTPKLDNTTKNGGGGGGRGDGGGGNEVSAEEEDDNMHTPKPPPDQHDAEHPVTVHDFSPPPTPGRDHDVHWEKEPPMPEFLEASHLDDDDAVDELAKLDISLSGSGKKGPSGNKFDAVYFSGSLSLLPDPAAALALTSKLLQPETGKVYVTQTYQRWTPPLLGYFKPLIKFFTTIDFGQLVTTNKILELYGKVAELEVESHKPIDGSVDNALQCAYVSVLRQKVEEDVI